MSHVDDINEKLNLESQMEFDALGASYIPSHVINSFKLIPVAGLSQEARDIVFRVNSLCNLYFFAVAVLGKNRFQTNPDPRKNLHLQMCNVVMKDGLKEVIEIPRDHFKSSVYSECFPIWRALPFTAQDEFFMLSFGASPIYIEWMKRIHNQDIRILLVSEVATNAVKLGVKVSNHYVNNGLFRHLFPEIIPDTSCTWKTDSLHQKRTKEGSQHGEGTFDFIGVGAALQSRHYDDVIQDDLVGRAALKSSIVMEDTVEYHKLLVGAFDADVKNASRDNNEIIVGNRWSYNDLNSHIREEEKNPNGTAIYNFITHSALGACCSLHPYGEPIFPEAFSVEKLARWKARLGTYLFSCQFLNYPINPEKVKFDKRNLRYFTLEKDTEANTFSPNQVTLQGGNKHYRYKICHKVAEGDVEDDVWPRNLKRFMIVDPNHSGQKGRCRHAISITGILQKPERIYLLDQWAKAVNYGEFIQQIFRMAKAWKMTEIWIEVVGFQKFLKFYLDEYVRNNRNKPGNEFMNEITFKELKSPTTANAKEERIDAFIPLTERKIFWVNRDNCAEFLEEIEKYGNAGALIDLLDTISYGPQVWKFEDVSDAELEKYLQTRQQRFLRAMRTQARA